MEDATQETYTHGHASVVVAAHARRTAEEAARFLLPHLKPGMRIVDVGCGPGSITTGLARYVAPGVVLGVDNAAHVLEAARSHAAARNVDNVRFEVASAYALPVADASVDVVYAHQVLQHLADPLAALGEAGRVLVDGGYVAVRDADYGTMTHHPHEPLLDRWLEVYCAMARRNGGEPDAGRHLLEWVGAAGFSHVVATASTWMYADPEARQEWAELWANRMTLDHIVARAEELEISDRTELAAIAAAWRNWAARPTGWFAFIHGEVLATRG
jgi:SAM-dependent methyltransferase